MVASGEDNDVKTTAKSPGLRDWMERVLQECNHVSGDFSADPVHDLRVALRRCRSLADGMISMDPERDWKAMKKAGKRLFQRLGALRAVQIMMEWIEKLAPTANQAARTPSPALLPSAGTSSDAAPATPFVEVVVDNSRDPVARALLEILKAREFEQKRQARAALDEFDRKQWRQWSQSLPLRAARLAPGRAG